MRGAKPEVLLQGIWSTATAPAPLGVTMGAMVIRD
jgi:hypothetical protein